MGGGAMNIDFPVIQLPASSAKPPSSSPSLSASDFNTVSLKQSWTASSGTHRTDTRKKLESADRTEDKRASGSSDNSVFGAVPSKFEVENAIAALQNFMHAISSSGPVLECCDLRTLISQGYGRVYDTFRFLQTDPSVKRLVVSLASDKAIWDAVMSNDLVRQLQGLSSLIQPSGEMGKYQSSVEEPNLATELLKWIMDKTKAKIMELIRKFQELVNEVFQPLDRGKPTEEPGVEFDDKVRSSLLLSIVILLIVVVARAHEV